MDFKKLNNIGGWISFIIALVVYTATVESSVSLWDCGEFLSAAYKLQVVHPPGAPFFLLLGRIFSLFAMGNVSNVAFWINMLSAVSSAACVMFTFWITTYFARKLVNETNEQKTIIVLGAGFVAALTNTFIDTFWFSAVEAEVYALSSFFTAVSFWALVRWDASTNKYADRWMIFIAFMVGLGLSTHMLNLLIIPVAGIAYYFKNAEKTVTIKGLLLALLASGIGLLFVMNFVYPGIPWLLSRFDYFFVNSLGLPFYSGAIFSVLFIIAALVAIVKFTKNNYNWNLMAVSLVFIILGYSSYAMVTIRSLADPAIDMNDPEDPYRFYGYITREQYGERPLMHGPFFNSQPVDTREVGQKYFKGKEKYEAGDMKFEYVYDPSEQILFPRMGATGRPNDDVGYRLWSGMGDIQDQLGQLRESGGSQTDIQALEMELPTMGNNLQFFWNYQMGHMYKRYFLWNFAGRFNDQQKMLSSELDGSWYSGLPFIDYFSVGSLDGLPDYYKNQKGKNAYYFLPLILGVLGMIIQFKKNRNGFLLVLSLFLFTGILINVYLNPPPFEPRERDYSLVGSFQTFCIWVGLGVVMLAEFLRKYLKGTAAIAATTASILLVPVNMGFQNWDDHNRSNRYIGKNSAENFLETLDKNAILICNGDNDTYPLWYLQNVEGVRTDVRIINMSLLPTEWYSSVLLDKVMESEPLPLTLTRENLEAGSMDNGIRINPGTMDLRSAITECLKTARNTNNGCFWPARTVSFKSYKELAAAAGIIRNSELAQAADSITFSVSGNYITKGDVVLYDYIENNARTGWKRPLYFTSVSGYNFNGLNNYLRLEGMVYKFVPINGGSQSGRPNNMDKEVLYTNLTKNYKYYGIKENPNFYLDDKASYVISQMKNWSLELAMTYASEVQNYDRYKLAVDSGKPMSPPAGYASASAFISQKANDIEQSRKRGLELVNKMRVEIAEPQIIWSRNDKSDFALAYLVLGDRKNGEKLLDDAVKDLTQFHSFYNARYPSMMEKSRNREIQINYQTASNILTSLRNYGFTDLLTKYESKLKPMVDIFKQQ